MKITCDIVLDLIPLVKDGVASEDSCRIVREHIALCKSCRDEFEELKSVRMEETALRDKKIIFSIKRSLFISQVLVLIIGAIAGVALTGSAGMFYNFLIMPVIGVAGFFLLKKKWYLLILGVFSISYLWQAIQGIMAGGYYPFYGGVYLSTIYTFLVFLGMIIAMLLNFVFKKDR